MQQDVQALHCDAPECEEQLIAPVRGLVERARAAGWQAREVRSLSLSDDGPAPEMTDRCPDHHTQTLSREWVLEQAGGPGGLQPWMLP